jgi:hypothetical protein
MHAIARIILFVGLLAPGARAGGQPAGREPAPVHWSVALGMRVERVNRSFPTVDQVVLVPDAAAYLEELSRWSPRGRWPVLFEDDHLAPMFIRRFRPAHVIRRGPAAGGTAIEQSRLEATVVGAWGGDPDQERMRPVFDRLGHVPPGVVVASVRDPAWTAAVALAAGRGQPIGWLDESFGRPNQAIDPRTLSRLQAAVDSLVAATGYAHEALGDAIDAITLCRAVGGRVDLAAPGGRPEIRAVTDMLGRLNNGRRYAFTGWIFGDEARCAYAAMSALFLARERFLLVNTYPRHGAWGAYGIDAAAELLSKRGWRAEAADGDAAGLRAWLEMLPGGISADVVVMNTKGNTSFFDLADGRAYCGDVPMLDEPAAVHFTHSWSMASPESPGTVAGRWLAHGAYAYVGSTQEPTLSAFLPPELLAGRWVQGVPWLIGARRWDGSPAWKVNTFGDPLMLCRPLVDPAPQRLEGPIAEGQDLRARAETLMRQADADNDDNAFAEAVATLALLGADETAARLWQVADDRGHGAEAAPAALGPLFRLRRTDAFVRAWQQTGQRDRLAADMLWHLLTPRLAAAGEQELLLLESAIRPSLPEADLQRLAPHLTATFGAAHTRKAIQREIDRTQRPGTRKKLQQLLEDL